MSINDTPEPWLRGPIPDVHPLLAPVLYSFEQAREDLDRWTSGLTDAQIWDHPHGLAPVGFHLRHIAGSVERLMTYVTGGQLTADQITTLGSEIDPGPGRDQLLREVAGAFHNAATIVRALDPATLNEPREVGRRKLPSTVGGLLSHIAEHTQRHVGEAIITAKILKQPPKS
jgi:hypothetical protein